MTFITRLTAQWVPSLRKYVFVQQEIGSPKNVAYAIGGSSGGGGTDVVPTGPWGPQIPYIQQLMQGANQLYQQGPTQYPDFSTVAGPNQNLQNSQQGILNFVNQSTGLNQGAINTAANAAATAGQNPVSQAAQPLVPGLQQGIQQLLLSGNNPLARSGQQTTPGAQNAINTATGQAGYGGNVSTPGLSGGNIDLTHTLMNNLGGSGLNPFIDQTVQAATRGLTNNFQRNVLPSIGDSASGAGQYGGTRQGVAQGIAAGDYQQNVGDVTAQLYAQGFDRNVQAQQQALQQIGQTQAQQGAFNLQGQQLGEQIRNNSLGQALQGAQLSQGALQGGLGLGQQGIATGTSQAGNLLQGGQSQNLQQMFGALGLIPSLQGNQLAQLGAANQAGLQQQGFQQGQLDDMVNRFFYEQYAPYNALSQYQNYIGGSYGSSVGGAPNNLAFPGLSAANLGGPYQPGAQPYPYYRQPAFAY